MNIIDMASMGFRTKSVTSALLAGILCGCAAPSDVTMSQAADATYSGVIDEPVTLVEMESGHLVACHYANEIAVGAIRMNSAVA